MGNFPSQQNTPLDPRQAQTPLTPPSDATPIMPGQPQEPVSTPVPGQPMGSQGMPTGQVPGGQPEMATPEQRQELLNMLEATRDKMSELQSAKFRSANEQSVAQMEVLKEIFTMMQNAGVDLSDPASVGTFLTKLQSTSPEMASLFEQTLDQLIGGDLGEQQMGMQAPQFGDNEMGEMPDNEMMENETLSQDVRGPIPPQGGGQA